MTWVTQCLLTEGVSSYGSIGQLMPFLNLLSFGFFWHKKIWSVHCNVFDDAVSCHFSATCFQRRNKGQTHRIREIKCGRRHRRRARFRVISQKPRSQSNPPGEAQYSASSSWDQNTGHKVNENHNWEWERWEQPTNGIKTPIWFLRAGKIYHFASSFNAFSRVRIWH